MFGNLIRSLLAAARTLARPDRLASVIEQMQEGGNLDLANARLVSALRRFPDSTALNMIAAELAKQLGDFEKASCHLLKVIANRDISKVEELFRSADCCKAIARYDLAKLIYEKLADHPARQVAVHAHYELALLAYRVDNASMLNHLVQATCLEDHQGAYRLFRNVKLADPGFIRDCRRKLESLSEEGRGHELHLAIADLLTLEGEFGLATHRISKACDKKNRQLSWSIQCRSAPLCTTEHQEIRRPNYLIIGAMKCGTTSLYDYINQHPQCVPAVRKEVHFFGGPPRPNEWYCAHFPPVFGSDRVTGEASPSYYGRDIAKRIRQTYPDIKLIFIARNPVKRTISHFLHSKRKVNVRANVERLVATAESYFDLHSMNDDEAELAVFQRSTGGRGTQVAYSFYFYYLRRWLRVFENKQILLLSLEELSSNPTLTMERVYDFLGVDTGFPCSPELRNQGEYSNLEHIDPHVTNLLTELFEPSVRKLEKEIGLQLGCV